MKRGRSMKMKVRRGKEESRLREKGWAREKATWIKAKTKRRRGVNWKEMKIWRRQIVKIKIRWKAKVKGVRNDWEKATISNGKGLISSNELALTFIVRSLIWYLQHCSKSI